MHLCFLNASWFKLDIMFICILIKGLLKVRIACEALVMKLLLVALKQIIL